MNIYDAFYGALYTIIEKIGDTNSDYDKRKRAYIASIIISIIEIFNLMTIYNLLNSQHKISYHFNLIFGVIIYLLNLFYFVNSKRYININNQISELDFRIRNRYTVFLIIFSILSISLQFITFFYT